MSRIVGIAGRQGNCQEHKNILESLGIRNKIIIEGKDIKGITHLILPGGESTTQEMLWRKTKLWKEIKAFDNPTLGTCAGAIHLSKKYKNYDVYCKRNAFGNQKESFYKEMNFGYGKKPTKKLKAMFIRAPRIFCKENNGHFFEEWANFEFTNGKTEVAVAKIGKDWLSTCHPEAVGDDTLHKRFLEI